VSDLRLFLAGMATMGFLVAALFFLRFFVHTRDRLFAAFGIAFLLLAANQGATALAGVSEEELSWLYLLRLAGFGLLIGAIIARNVRARRSNLPK
jgi:hypothetical protein